MGAAEPLSGNEADGLSCFRGNDRLDEDINSKCCCVAFSIMVLVTATLIIVCMCFPYPRERDKPIIKHYGQAKFDVSNASLTQFNILSRGDDDGNNNVNNLIGILHYQGIINITATNPSNEAPYTILYDDVEARAYYKKLMFGTMALGSIYVEPNSTTTVIAIFMGKKSIVLGDEVSEIKDNNGTSGVYGIEVKLSVKSNNQWEPHASFLPKNQITCDLKVPLSLCGRDGGAFKRTPCYYN
ncbi:Protein YLS [Trema orientale]|uniref:Protein YLS n=1 Tax=Trema orientale TaxID=63057 RepID=A0A2P5B9B3_TREOI|nr:Protein YLS [Trema orientale]